MRFSWLKTWENWLETAKNGSERRRNRLFFHVFGAHYVAGEVMKIVAGLLMMIAMNHLVACMWFGIASMTDSAETARNGSGVDENGRRSMKR